MGGRFSMDEFRLYAMDRDLYITLVRDLSRNSSESLNVMGLWLWFERNHIPNVIAKISSMPPKLITLFADEAVECLNIIRYPSESPSSPVEPIEVQLTSILLEADVFSRFLSSYSIRATGYHEIYKLVSNIYIPALSDIMEQARRGELRPKQVRDEDRLAWHSSTLSFQDGDCVFTFLDEEIMKFRRTVFLVFPIRADWITDEELREFFTGWLGNCIESLHMHEVGQWESPRYARICFKNRTDVEAVLAGLTMNRLDVGRGKRMWATQSMPRDKRVPFPCGCVAVGLTACPHSGPSC